MQMQSRIDRQDLARTSAAVPARAPPSQSDKRPGCNDCCVHWVSKVPLQHSGQLQERERCQTFSGVRGGEEMKELEWARGVNLRGI